MAATNKDLLEMVNKGLFRDDLYYRINIVKLVLPPLRKRKEDIPLLAEHFLRKYGNFRDKEIQGLSHEAMGLLMAYDFPGNVRELENIIEYATVVCKNHLIRVNHLPETLQPRRARQASTLPLEAQADEPSMGEVERNFIYEALRKHKWSRKLTAAQMGIHSSTLWRKMKRLNITVPKQNG